MISLFGDVMDVKPEGYARGQKISGNHLRARTTRISICKTQTISWTNAGGEHGIKLAPDKTYVRPSGYKVHMEKPPGAEPRVAARRHRGRRHVLPQALHGFRRRQIGNFQAHHRRDSHRPGVRRGFEKGF